MQRRTALLLLAVVCLLAVALGGVLLHSPATLPAGLLFLGIGCGIVFGTWLQGQK